MHEFYSPGFQPLWPTLGGLRQYMTVHDLIHLDDPHESSPLRKLYLERVLRPTIRTAGLVFTVSEYSRQRLLAWVADDAVRVVVTGNGCSLPRRGVPLSGASESRPPYVLYVGNYRPQKNFPLLLSAMTRLERGLRLVCVGGRPDDLAVGSAEAEVLAGRTTFLRDVDDTELAELYAGAAAVAMPSTIEGFGLPAVEALICGTSVAYCSDAVAEVVGPYGFRADPRDPTAFADALTAAMRVSGSEREAGIEWAAGYSWEKVADVVTRTLADVVG